MMHEIRESSVFAQHTEHLLSPKLRARRRRRVTHAQLRRAGVEDVSSTSSSGSSAASGSSSSSESSDEEDADWLYDLRRNPQATRAAVRARRRTRGAQQQRLQIHDTLTRISTPPHQVSKLCERIDRGHPHCEGESNSVGLF